MKYTALALLLITLSACGGSAAPEIYTLRATTPDVKTCTRGPGIKLYVPQTAPGLESARIVVIDRPRHQTFYNGVRWSAPVGLLVQNVMVDASERSGMFSLVTTDDSSSRTAWVLETQIRDFHVDLSDATPRAKIRLTVSFLRATGREPVLSLPLESTINVTGQGMEGVVAVFNDELNGLIEQALQQFRARIGCR